MTEDLVFVRKTRSEPDLPLLDTAREDIAGEHVWKGVMAEMKEALGDSLTSAAIMGAQMDLGLTGSHNATASLRRPAIVRYFRPAPAQPDRHQQHQCRPLVCQSSFT